MKLILDMDPGIDDALALMAACRSEFIEILGTTVVAGNLPLERVASNASGLLKHMGSNALVYKGASSPLYGQSQNAAEIHGLGGLGNWQIESDPARISSFHAVEFIAETARANPGQVTLVATGPLTNLALALEYHRQDMEQLAGVVFMGGALTVPGNVTPTAEFNIFSDPDAAQVVFNSGLNLTMVGLDVTQTVALNADDIVRLAAGNAYAQDVAAMAKYFLERHGELSLHDPLALMAALHPDLFEFKLLPVQVETRGQISRGQTVADFSRRQNWKENIRAALKVDKERCKAQLLDLWTR